MLSLTIASTRPWETRSAAWAKPSTLCTFAPAPRATCAQLLVSDWAVVLPLRSARVLMSFVPAAVTITPCEYVYGAENRYCASRSGLIVTWLAITSIRLASSAGKIASNGDCTNLSSQPAFLATASITSTS